MEETLKKFGLLDDGCGWVDKQGCYWSTLESALWGGVLGFCCCGEPNKGLQIVRMVLEAAEMNKYKEEYLFHYYVLNKLGLLEHGSSIYGSWLSEAGEAFLKILRATELWN